MYWNDIVIESEQYTYDYFLQEDVCRLCWSQNANHEIHSNNSDVLGINPSLSLKISDCLSIEVGIHQLNKVCSNCCEEINRFYDFKNFCYKTDIKLKEILQNGKVLSENELKIKDEIKDEAEDTNFDGNEDNNIEISHIVTSKKSKRNRRSHEKSPFYCKKCSLNLQSEEDLSHHNAESHGIESNGKLFKCFGCEKRFNNRRTRSSHEQKFCKQLKDGYKCVKCDRYLPKRSGYEAHMRNHRLNLDTEPPEYVFRCKKCLTTYKSKEQFKNHMAEHGKKNFVCDICGRVFTRRDYLYKHKLTHAGIKQHECPHCDFKATQRSSLTVHIRKHTGERPYSCDVCPQKCVSSSNLRAHRRRHLGVKKYECAICNKKFGYKISLEEHIASAHNQTESHTCEHCSATYTRLRGLRRHLAAKHGKLPPKNANNEEIIVNNVNNYEIKDRHNVFVLKEQDSVVFRV